MLLHSRRMRTPVYFSAFDRMFASEPHTIEVSGDDANLEEALESLPAGAGVYAVFPRAGRPHLGRTAVLRRRLKRLLRRREQPSRLLNLRDLATRLEYWPVASRLESGLILYELARSHMPDNYIEFLKLRMPPYVKLVLGNQFPRTHVTAR